MIIRPETTKDHQAIHDLTKAAFAPMPYGDENDAILPERLRDAGDLLLSLVAEDQGQVIAHVALSPVQVDAPGDWVGLGPISVEIARQKQGIGTAIAHEGLARMKAQGFSGCVLIGNPKVYGPMGFVSDGRLTYRDLCSDLVQWLSFDGSTPAGEIVFADALEA